MKKKVIFIYPANFKSEPKAASELRPQKMLEAFKGIGAEVFEIVGSSWIRKRLYKAAYKFADSNTVVYVELINFPLIFSDPDHFPRFPFLDFYSFFRLKGRSAKLAFFYRDIYWRFPEYARDWNWIKRSFAKTFFWIEWQLLCLVADVIFLPNLPMGSHFPRALIRPRFEELPPGTEIPQNKNKQQHSSGLEVINVLYIGGVSPPYYDLLEAFWTVLQNPRVKLTVCCREDEWLKMRDHYIRLLNSDHIKTGRLKVVHLDNRFVSQLYEGADVFLMFRPDSEYLKFAVPYKLFEAASYCVPILTNRGSLSGKIVAENKIGWAISDLAEVEAVLAQIGEKRNGLADFKDRLQEFRRVHSWKCRAQKVQKLI